MKTWKSVAAALTGAAMAAVALSGSAAAAEKWRYVGGLPMTHDYPQLLAKAFDKIRERTDGELDIQYVFIAETPYKFGEVMTVVRDGLIEGGDWVPSFVAGTYPILVAPEMPFLFPEKINVSAGQDATNAAWESPAMSEAVNKILGAHKAVDFGVRYYYEPMNFWFVEHETPTLDSFQGKKMRVFTPELSELILGLGANPVTMQSHEVYAALQRNLLDGLITGSGNIKGSKFHEVLNAGYIADPMYISAWPIVNKERYGALPDALKNVLDEEMRAVVEEIASTLEARDQEKRTEAEEVFGFKMATATPEEYQKLRAIAQERVWPKWLERAGEGAEAVLADVLKAVETPEG
ncbi:MAG: hypothetical protein TEF_08635 [Rhizobiales bacterium NRL2]|jgi:TRAP-type C4-dicarboxylate transport system substrate-binding protein|nr:MAG: hypothetical protein TEF_08635 [Rhizobiales bacterium NRL2]